MHVVTSYSTQNIVLGTSVFGIDTSPEANAY